MLEADIKETKFENLFKDTVKRKKIIVTSVQRSDAVYNYYDDTQ